MRTKLEVSKIFTSYVAKSIRNYNITLHREGYFNVSYATIYRHIKQHNLNRPYRSRGDTGIKHYLRHRGQRRHLKGERRHKEAQVNYISIHERPKFINQRKRIGDWEIDTVLGKAGKGVLVTAVERKTRYTLIGFSSLKIQIMLIKH
jgi:IS30 family transposase